MLSVQEKAIELLAEIDDICRANGIKYSLTEKTAAMAEYFGTYQSNEYLVEIMMTASDFKKFSELVEHQNNPNRVLESWSNNSKMMSLCARYVDTQTTLWDTIKGNHYKYKGIFVQINILRTNSNDNIFTKLFEKVAEWNNVIYLRYVMMYAPFSMKKYALLAVMLAFARIILVNNCVSKMVFNRLISSKEAVGKELFYTNLNGKRRKFKHDILAETRDIEFENNAFQIVSNSRKFVDSIYKDGAIEHARKTDYSVKNVNVVTDTFLPYTYVISKAEKENVYNKKKLKKKLKYESFLRFVLNPNKAKADKQWQYVRRTVDRFALWEEYMPIKEKIMVLYASGDTEELTVLMKPYIDKINNYAKKSMGFCFDVELLEVAYSVMGKDKNEIDKLRKLIPNEYKENLSDYLMKQGVTHELLGNTHGEN